MRRKKKIQQSIIFYDTNDYKELYKQFLIYRAKLIKEGCFGTGKDWWRYRWYEFLNCDKDEKDHQKWKEKTRKYFAWDDIWAEYGKKIDDENFI